MSENQQQVQPQAESSETSETTSSPQPLERTETEVASMFEEVDFSALSEIADGKEPESVPEASEPEETEEEQEPVSEEPDEAEEVEEEPLAAEAEEPEPAKEEAVEEEPAPEPVKLPTKEELEGMYDKFREDSLPHLEKLYEMDEETATAFDENPREVLPKIAAKLHFDAMMSTYNAVTAAMPSLVGQVVKAMETANSAETAFYDAWPDLKGVKPEIVQTAVRSYRQANPTAKLETVISNAGRLAMINAGLDPTPKPKAQPKPKKAPPKPASPAGANPTPPPRPKKPGDENVFAELTEAWDSNQFS